MSRAIAVILAITYCIATCYDFIVLGDTFAENDNMAQAKATFESIKSGYKPYGPEDEVLDQVELRLRKL